MDLQSVQLLPYPLLTQHEAIERSVIRVLIQLES